jgi:peroxiredoxin
LPDPAGKPVSLSQFRGRPVVVIFYLGHGCPHCVEQLTKFAPKAKEFGDAGLALVAISTDSLQNLKKAEPASGTEGAFPFPLLSDAPLEVFKAYRSYDGFENRPLHGTFLIDANGLVRWQDISYEPFTDADFLLKEAKRLLRVPASALAETAARTVPGTGRPLGPVW